MNLTYKDMNIIKKIENEYRSMKGYGVQFSIEPDAYSCDDAVDVAFGENETAIQGGEFHNFQDVFLDGKTIGYLWERKNGRVFDPMMASFCVVIADCQDDDFDDVYSRLKNHPNFYDEGEAILFRFATLKQMLEYVAKAAA